MASISELSLDAATSEEAPLLGNLLELYVHDLSAVFPNVVMGPDGRFGYPKLPLYWSEPERRFAFLIRCAGEVAGFALATRGSPVTDDPAVFDVAEFFVLRRYRRSGVGRRAARLLWDRLPGRWTVRVAEHHQSGLEFWRAVVAEAAGTPVAASTSISGSTSWQVFTFEPLPAHTTG